MNASLVFILTVYVSLVFEVSSQITEKLVGNNPCISKQNCSECIQTPTCAWCAQPNFTIDGKPLPRCNQQNRFVDDHLRSQCHQAFIINPDNQYTELQNLGFSKGSSFSSSSSSSSSSFSHDAVQIKPQRVRMKLRINEAYDLKLSYSQAEDYPVDLYYLMDLSKSMEDDKDKLSELGGLLATEMGNITSNFRLGFGSFVDKVVMPYVNTVPKKLEEPCESCAAPYGFKNHMPLDTDASRFEHEVKSAEVSGNLDAPEGGFDAIMQAIACKNQIGWRNKARKLLVFSTDASFHYAGDGKLGGIVTPNDGDCHLDGSGRYTHSEKMDYPSVSQINKKVKDNSINLIFAVTAEQRRIYDQLRLNVEGSSSGTLSNDSSNVVSLVRQQYDKISSSIEIKDNATNSIAITYFSSCLTNGPPKQTNKCDGIKIGDIVDFTAKIEVLDCPKNRSQWHQLIEIYPVAINESLLVDVEMLCDCECEQPGNPGFKPKDQAEECSYAGNLMCGICVCDDTHFGRQCECDNSKIEKEENQSTCRPDNTTEAVCSGRGHCVCGVCECYRRPNPNEIVSGTFCQCDDFSCDRGNGLLCSGPDHGECYCGACKCKSGWSGPACECRNTTESCIPPDGGKPCSGNGECDCGVCYCHVTASGNRRYSGKYCEWCPTCDTRCKELSPCVQCQVYKTGKFTQEECLNCSFVPLEEDKPQKIHETDEECTVVDDDDCRFVFVYGYNEEGEFVVRAQKPKDCPEDVNILLIVLAVIGAIVAIGLALLLMWKLLTTIHDRREYARFEMETKKAKWDTGENPIFKQATSTFKNPTYGGK